MGKFASTALAAVVLCASTAVVFAAPQAVGVRGTIESVTAHTLVMKTYDGKTDTLKIGGKTTFASVVPGRLDGIKRGDFVGIGATGGTDRLQALEVVIFPDSMRGAGEGHYPWSVPAVVAAADRGGHAAGSGVGGPPVRGTMTNGTVTNAVPVSAGPPVQGTMTNGTVTNSTDAASGRTLTVSYNNGRHVDITVSASSPVVRLVPASRSVMVPNAKAFVKATKAGDGTLTTAFVAVGKDGLMPPN